jgi:hypothetical protein
MLTSLRQRRPALLITFPLIDNQNDCFYDLMVPPTSMHGKRQGALEFNAGNGTVKGAREVRDAHWAVGLTVVNVNPNGVVHRTR